jgi:hypothetical protein
LFLARRFLGGTKEQKNGAGIAHHTIDASLVRLAGCQPAVLFSHIKLVPATDHLSASSIFLSQQISTSYQPPATSHQPAEQAGCPPISHML